MDDLALIKESHLPLPCIVDKLAGEYKVSGRDLLPEGTDRGRGQDVGAALVLQCLDVGPEVNGAREY